MVRNVLIEIQAIKKKKPDDNNEHVDTPKLASKINLLLLCPKT